MPHEKDPYLPSSSRTWLDMQKDIESLIERYRQAGYAGKVPVEDIESVLERYRRPARIPGSGWIPLEVDMGAAPGSYLRLGARRTKWTPSEIRSWVSSRRHIPIFDMFDRAPDEAPRLKPLLDERGMVKAFEVESPVEMLERRIDELYEHLLFQNLVPAFDDIPMRRVFPVYFYTPEQWTEEDKFGMAVQQVIEASGCYIVQEYPFLEGSGLYRGSLQKPNRQTRRQFETSQQQIAEHLVHTLKESNINIIGNLSINISVGTSAELKGEPKDWTGKLKDLTEAVKNMLLIAASAIFVFDGTLIKSSLAEAQKPREVAVLQIDRKTELEILPKILDATRPEEFHDIIDSLPAGALPAEKPKAPPIRKFRKE